ncbi:LysM domain-containing protein [Arthrobacter sp. efr-133-R2A-120]|uniref:LysM peptidoglycan-binding domain-containing protein n=1 Tax=Arthrobacter sp. efr-133-R2A-120 TaxID=3040277 RepID=UPI00254F3AFF|nr:LysM domain-containing protein [Arthrobacter sp. efr-133-R2A-120]
MGGGATQGDGLKAYIRTGSFHVRTIGSLSLLAASAMLLASCAYSEPAPSPSISPSPQAAVASASSSSAPLPEVAGKVSLSSYKLPVKYTTVAGDTWASIAKAFELKEESLKAFQAKAIDAEPAPGTVVDLRGVDYQRPGASGEYEKDASGQPDVYIVQAGDNPGAVAARFGIPVRQLVTDNKLPGMFSLSPEDTASFKPGMKLKLQNPS